MLFFKRLPVFKRAISSWPQHSELSRLRTRMLVSFIFVFLFCKDYQHTDSPIHKKRTHTHITRKHTNAHGMQTYKYTKERKCTDVPTHMYRLSLARASALFLHFLSTFLSLSFSIFLYLSSLSHVAHLYRMKPSLSFLRSLMFRAFPFPSLSLSSFLYLPFFFASDIQK